MIPPEMRGRVDGPIPVGEFGAVLGAGQPQIDGVATGRRRRSRVKETQPPLPEHTRRFEAGMKALKDAGAYFNNQDTLGNVRAALVNAQEQADMEYQPPREPERGRYDTQAPVRSSDYDVLVAQTHELQLSGALGEMNPEQEKAMDSFRTVLNEQRSSLHGIESREKNRKLRRVGIPAALLVLAIGGVGIRTAHNADIAEKQAVERSFHLTEQPSYAAYSGWQIEAPDSNRQFRRVSQGYSFVQQGESIEVAVRGANEDTGIEPRPYALLNGAEGIGFHIPITDPYYARPFGKEFDIVRRGQVDEALSIIPGISGVVTFVDRNRQNQSVSYMIQVSSPPGAEQARYTMYQVEEVRQQTR